MGRPFLFDTEEELKKRIDEYWDYCELKERPMTFCGLAYFLGMTRQTLHNYSRRDKYSHIIEEAKNRIEMDTEERLQIAGQATTGIIFSLKNNYKWNDKQEIEAVVDNTNKNYDLSNLTTDEIKELLKDE